MDYILRKFAKWAVRVSTFKAEIKYELLMCYYGEQCEIAQQKMHEAVTHHNDIKDVLEEQYAMPEEEKHKREWRDMTRGMEFDISKDGEVGKNVSKAGQAFDNAKIALETAREHRDNERKTRLFLSTLK